MNDRSHLFSDLKENQKKIQSFLDACRKQHKSDIKDFSSFRKIFQKRTEQAEEFFGNFQKDMEPIPFELAIEYWLDNHAVKAGLTEACEIFKIFISEKIIHLEKNKGKIFTLQDQAILGDAGYIDDIRCLENFSFRQREQMVAVYLQFSRYLAHATLGFVPAQPDPDRIKVEKKSVAYDIFLDFIQYLSERDAAMAYLMYFDEPSMVEIINLKVSQVNVSKNGIIFGQHEAIYPKHVVQRLQQFMIGKKKNELVFQNRNNEAVNRSRIYKAFKIASSKMRPPQEITPMRLLEKHQ